MKGRLQRPENLEYKYEAYGAPAYDAIWVIGLMLHKAALELEGNSSKQLEDFTYNDSEMKDLFFRLLGDTEFEGVSVFSRMI